MAAQQLFETEDIVTYLSGIISEKFAQVLGETGQSVIDLSAHYQSISQSITEAANEATRAFGICIIRVVLENISLPEEVEKLVDEQSGIGMAKQDMDNFLTYQNARALRDAAKQEGGLAGLGAGVALGGVITDQVTSTARHDAQPAQSKEQADPVQAVRELKELLDEGILTQEEFDAKKKELLNL